MFEEPIYSQELECLSVDVTSAGEADAIKTKRGMIRSWRVNGTMRIWNEIHGERDCEDTKLLSHCAVSRTLTFETLLKSRVMMSQS